MNQCFKIKNGTDYDKAVKKHFQQRPKWNSIMNKVGELLGEKISKMALVVDNLWVDTYELTKEENKKLFNKDGKLKSNTKKAKEMAEQYKHIISEEGISDFQELSRINFTYGLIRMQGQRLESFVTSEHDIYYKADFDLEKRAEGLVLPITQIEYEEKYLEELKKRTNSK